MSDETYHWPEASVWSVLATTHEFTSEQFALLIATHTVEQPAASAA